MDLTYEDFQRQLDLQAMYRDDKFAGLLKGCSQTMKQAKEAQIALDAREKDLKVRERQAQVVLDSQEEFSRQKSLIEAKNLEDQQHNQRSKDAIAVDRAAVDADIRDAKALKEEADTERRKAETARKSAETKNAKAEAALADAEAMKAQWTARLEELGLKAA